MSPAWEGNPAWEAALDEFAEAAKEGLKKPLSLDLPGRGRLKVDRVLPFLVLVREPVDRTDELFAQLFHTGAAYLVWDEGAAAEEFGDQAERTLEGLLRELIKIQLPPYRAFLMIEIEPSEDLGGTAVYLRRNEELAGSRQTLELRLPALGFDEKLTLEYREPSGAEGWSPTLASDWARRHGVMPLGIRVPPLYRNEAGAFLPGRFRAYRRRLDIALKHVAFRFVREATTERPPHFQVFGTQTPSKVVWRVDRELEQISESFSFLLDITPLHSERAYQAFARSGYRTEPRWQYRPLTIDPPLLLRELYKIPIEQVEDPAFYRLFEQKRRQLELKIQMLAHRRRPDFLHASLSLYGGVEPSLVALAKRILKAVPKSRGSGNERFLSAEEFAERAREEVAWYRAQDPRFTARVEVRDELGRSVMCQHGNLLIGREAKVAPGRVEALLQHEVGIHLVTTYNGRSQPLRLLGQGLADYLAFQEGMALVAEVVVGGLDRRRLRYLAGRVLAVESLLRGRSFVETFEYLRDRYGFALRRLFDLVSRVYRGGGFTKDAIYLQGLVKTLEVLPKQDDLGGVFVGKIGFEHISLIRELQWRLVLEPAPFLPRFLGFPQARATMERLRQGIDVLELLELNEGV